RHGDAVRGESVAMSPCPLPPISHLALPDGGRRGGREGIALLDGCPDELTTLRWCKFCLCRDLRRRRCQVVVFDGIAKPARVVTAPEMVHPGRIIHTLS